MSTQQETASRLTTADLVAGEVRAQMARKNLKARALVPVLGLSQGQVSQRINGHIEWRLSEIDVLAGFLGCDPSDLLVVRREGLEPPTRCLSASSNVIELFSTTPRRAA